MDHFGNQNPIAQPTPPRKKRNPNNLTLYNPAMFFDKTATQGKQDYI
jgi:hypothetical protein